MLYILNLFVVWLHAADIFFSVIRTATLAIYSTLQRNRPHYLVERTQSLCYLSSTDLVPYAQANAHVIRALERRSLRTDLPK